MGGLTRGECNEYSQTSPVMHVRQCRRVKVFKITARKSPGGGLEFLLSDNGPGVPPALQDRLFDLFTTHGKVDGSGLGLAIVKRIVEDHDGVIHFETRRHVGTTFRIVLPPRMSADAGTKD